MQDTYRVSGPNAAALTAITAELAKNPLNLKYVEGMAAINDFSKRNYTGLGSGSKFQHTSPKIESAAAQMQEKFAGVPHIEEVAKQLGQPTTKK